MTIHVIGESPGGKPKLDWLLMILPELVTGAALLVESRHCSVSEIESTILAAIGGDRVGTPPSSEPPDTNTDTDTTASHTHVCLYVGDTRPTRDFPQSEFSSSQRSGRRACDAL